MTGFYVISLRKLWSYWRIGAIALIAGMTWPALLRSSPSSVRGGKNSSHIVWYVPTHQKVVALTFDDGPSIHRTPAILKVLHDAHAHATFFVTGINAAKHPKILREEQLMGMQVENHTWGHINLRQHSQAQIAADLRHANAVITKATGHTPTLIRPPYGAYSRTVVNTARSMGMTVVMWSWTEDSRDWSNPGVGTIVQNVLQHVQPGDIILFHDGGSSRQTVRALPIVLRDLSARGYRFVTVGQLMRMKS